MRHASWLGLFSRVVLVSCCALGACRLQSEAANPFAGMGAIPGSAKPDQPKASVAGPATNGAGVSGSAQGASSKVGGGATAVPAAGSSASGAGGTAVAGSAAHDAGSGMVAAGGAAVDPPPRGSDAAVSGGAGSCKPKVEFCNPVTNEGCPPSTQCAVDFTAATLAGYCIFSAPMPMLDGSCFNSGVTESCPPSATCFEFQCRSLCFCDADCTQGQCCVDPVGSLGFKVCGDC